MSAWDIDEEENTGYVGKPGKEGYHHYGLIISYEGTIAKHLTPHHIKRDSNGDPVKSVYKKTENQTEKGTNQTVLEDKVEKWVTTKDVLDQLNSQSRQACNALKGYLSKNMVMVWYHNGADDECSQYGQRHWHVIQESERGANGKWRYLHDVTAYRALKVKCAAANGYVKAEGVKSLPNLIRHLFKPPRQYFGCNYKGLHQAYLQAKVMTDPIPPLKECLESCDADEDTTIECKKRYSTWDDSDEEESKKAAKRKQHWDEDDDAQHNFFVPPPSKAIAVIKETTADINVRLLQMLMRRYKANNMSEMWKAIHTLPVGVDEKYKDLWKRMSVRANMPKLMQSTLSYLKCINMSKTFQQLVEEYCKQPDTLPSNKYESVDDSYRIFLGWCKHQRIDAAEFITNIMDVMNKVNNKVNTICLVGPTNCGKTVIVATPLTYIMRYFGEIGNRGNASQFIWQECVNCSMIVINECVMAPEHLEDLKLILGGERLRSQVKHLDHATIDRTPVVLTGNNPPWHLNYAEKDAFMSRMFYYEVVVDNELEHVKYLHPGMWWYLMQQYGKFDKLTPKSCLRPYPEVEDVYKGDDDNAYDENPLE